jgi:hypothetical protein
VARKPNDLIQINLRVREHLRRRLEREAKRRQVSINFEMTSRLELTFEKESARAIDEVAADIAINWAHFGSAFHELNKQGDLLRATEALLKQFDALPGEIQKRKALQETVAQARTTIGMIEIEAKQLARRMHTGGQAV